MSRITPTLRHGAAVCAAMLLCLAWTAAMAAPLEFGSTRIRFATAEEGRALLGREDDWTCTTGAFQRRAMLHTTEPVSKERLAAFTASSVRSWPEAEEARWRLALGSIAPRWVALGLKLPDTVWLVNTDAADGGEAPHTRFNTVILSSRGPQAANSPASDMQLMAHELFHVASRHDPALATRLYALLGYEPVPLLEWPAAWEEARLSNPDAPFDRHAMRIATPSGEALVMPLLVARRTELAGNETFFNVLDVRLLQVEVDRSAGRTRAVMAGSEPAWLPVRTPAYLERLGGNTGYVIHAEETMADNVAFLVCETPVPNPALLERIATVLRSPP